MIRVGDIVTIDGTLARVTDPNADHYIECEARGEKLLCEPHELTVLTVREGFEIAGHPVPEGARLFAPYVMLFESSPELDRVYNRLGWTFITPSNEQFEFQPSAWTLYARKLKHGYAQSPNPYHDEVVGWAEIESVHGEPARYSHPQCGAVNIARAPLSDCWDALPNAVRERIEERVSATVTKEQEALK